MTVDKLQAAGDGNDDSENSLTVDLLGAETPVAPKKEAPKQRKAPPAHSRSMSPVRPTAKSPGRPGAKSPGLPAQMPLRIPSKGGRRGKMRMARQFRSETSLGKNLLDLSFLGVNSRKDKELNGNDDDGSIELLFESSIRTNATHILQKSTSNIAVIPPFRKKESLKRNNTSPEGVAIMAADAKASNKQHYALPTKRSIAKRLMMKRSNSNVGEYFAMRKVMYDSADSEEIKQEPKTTQEDKEIAPLSPKRSKSPVNRYNTPSSSPKRTQAEKPLSPVSKAGRASTDAVVSSVDVVTNSVAELSKTIPLSPKKPKTKKEKATKVGKALMDKFSASVPNFGTFSNSFNFAKDETDLKGLKGDKLKKSKDTSTIGLKKKKSKKKDSEKKALRRSLTSPSEIGRISQTLSMGETSEATKEMPRRAKSSDDTMTSDTKISFLAKKKTRVSKKKSATSKRGKSPRRLPDDVPRNRLRRPSSFIGFDRPPKKTKTPGFSDPATKKKKKKSSNDRPSFERASSDLAQYFREASFDFDLPKSETKKKSSKDTKKKDKSRSKDKDKVKVKTKDTKEKSSKEKTKSTGKMGDRQRGLVQRGLHRSQSAKRVTSKSERELLQKTNSSYFQKGEGEAEANLQPLSKTIINKIAAIKDETMRAAASPAVIMQEPAEKTQAEWSTDVAMPLETPAEVAEKPPSQKKVAAPAPVPPEAKEITPADTVPPKPDQEPPAPSTKTPIRFSMVVEPVLALPPIDLPPEIPSHELDDLEMEAENEKTEKAGWWEVSEHTKEQLAKDFELSVSNYKRDIDAFDTVAFDGFESDDKMEAIAAEFSASFSNFDTVDNYYGWDTNDEQTGGMDDELDQMLARLKAGAEEVEKTEPLKHPAAEYKSGEPSASLVDGTHEESTPREPTAASTDDMQIQISPDKISGGSAALTEARAAGPSATIQTADDKIEPFLQTKEPKAIPNPEELPQTLQIEPKMLATNISAPEATATSAVVEDAGDSEKNELSLEAMAIEENIFMAAETDESDSADTDSEDEEEEKIQPRKRFSFLDDSSDSDSDSASDSDETSESDEESDSEEDDVVMELRREPSKAKLGVVSNMHASMPAMGFNFHEKADDSIEFSHHVEPSEHSRDPR
jgi:hypothetical protein